jgi:hypothetical protein
VPEGRVLPSRGSIDDMGMSFIRVTADWSGEFDEGDLSFRGSMPGAEASHGLSLSTGMVEAEDMVSSILGSNRRRWRGPEEKTSRESNQTNRSQGGPALAPRYN